MVSVNKLSFVMILFLFCALFHLSSAKSDYYKIINTEYGDVQGILKSTWLNNVDYYSFKGIPYAEPPVGELRFRPPIATEPWAPEVFDASEHGDVCFSPKEFAISNSVQGEDCLVLNIYAPTKVPDDKLAVMVFIHGGSYAEYSGNDQYFGPDFLIEKQVILVTINYRLGVFGFLSLDTPQFSGNMGLKDQQMALKWIHNNIANFGGDPNRITLMGHDAGASSAHLHVLSSESNQYFRNAILLSGTAMAPWAISDEKSHITYAYQMAEDLGEPKESLEELIQFLQSVPPEKIVRYGSSMAGFHRTLDFRYAPVIERRDSEKPFLTQYPSEIYKTTKVPGDVIFSTTSSEILTYYAPIFQEIFDINSINTNFTINVPYRGFSLPTDSLEYRKLSKELRNVYFGTGSINDKSLQQYLNLLSDLNMVYPTEKAAKIHSIESTGKTYHFRFSVDSKLNYVKRLNSIKLAGAAHADEWCYLFRCNGLQRYYDEILKKKDDEQSKISLRAIDQITEIFSNFAKYGKPVPKDLRFEFNNEGLYLGANNDEKLRPNQEQMAVWDQFERIVDSGSSQKSGRRRTIKRG